MCGTALPLSRNLETLDLDQRQLTTQQQEEIGWLLPKGRGQGVFTVVIRSFHHKVKHRSRLVLVGIQPDGLNNIQMTLNKQDSQSVDQSYLNGPFFEATIEQWRLKQVSYKIFLIV